MPVQQCASYDVIGRVADYQLDPRNVKSNITAATDDQTTPEKTRRRRQIFQRKRGSSIKRQTIVGDDSITIVSSDSTSPSSPAGSPPPASTPDLVGTGFVPGAGGATPDDSVAVDATGTGSDLGVVGTPDAVGTPAAGVS